MISKFCPILKEKCIGSECVCWNESPDYTTKSVGSRVPPIPVPTGEVSVYCNAFHKPLKMYTYKKD